MCTRFAIPNTLLEQIGVMLSKLVCIVQVCTYKQVAEFCYKHDTVSIISMSPNTEEFHLFLWKPKGIPTSKRQDPGAK